MIPGGIGQKYNIVTDIRQRRPERLAIRMRYKNAEEMQKQGSHLSDHHALKGELALETTLAPHLN